MAAEVGTAIGKAAEVTIVAAVDAVAGVAEVDVDPAE